MDFKHFSHPHNLSFHQMPPGTETLCSGCNLAGLSNVYMCWQCQFFLHDQCFLAIRSITDPSHPPHPLSLLPSPTYPSGSFFCNSCTLPGSGFSYSCSHCDFDLHLHCANHVPPHHHMPNLNDSPSHNHPQIPNLNSQIPTTHHHVMNRPNTEVATNGVEHFSHRHPLHLSQLLAEDNINCSGCEKKISGSAYRCAEPGCKFTLHMACFGLPKELKHESHPAHTLSLLLSPAYKEPGTFTCDACLSIGTAFSYHCSACQFDLHTNCAFLPETVRRGDHSHPLALIYSLPFIKEDQLPADADATCDVCLGVVDIRKSWFYLCKECEFGTHVDCANAKVVSPKLEESQPQSQGDLIAAALLEFQMLQLQSKLSKINADFSLSSCSETINQLGKIG